MASQSNKKPKLVRDSFTIPKAEFAAIETLKTRAIALGTSVKKSELLRAGLMALQGLNDAAFKAALSAVPTLKTGRPTGAEKKPEAPTKKPVAKPAAKTAVKPALKAPVKVAAKAPTKPVVKTATQPVAKPVAAKTAAKKAAAPAKKVAAA